GDDLAEGIFALLDAGKRVKDADERYWRGFLADRATLILDIIDRTAKLGEDEVDAGQRRRMLASLKAAYGRLQTVMPDQFVGYLRAWRGGNTRGERGPARLP